MLVPSKTFRHDSLPKLTHRAGGRGHFTWRHLFYNHIPYCLLVLGRNWWSETRLSPVPLPKRFFWPLPREQLSETISVSSVLAHSIMTHQLILYNRKIPWMFMLWFCIANQLPFYVGIHRFSLQNSSMWRAVGFWGSRLGKGERMPSRRSTDHLLACCSRARSISWTSRPLLWVWSNTSVQNQNQTEGPDKTERSLLSPWREERRGNKT